MSKVKVKDIKHLMSILNSELGNLFSVNETNEHKGKRIYIWKFERGNPKSFKLSPVGKTGIRCFDVQSEQDIKYSDIRSFMKSGQLYHIIEGRRSNNVQETQNKRRRRDVHISNGG